MSQSHIERSLKLFPGRLEFFWLNLMTNLIKESFVVHFIVLPYVKYLKVNLKVKKLLKNEKKTQL